jgi:hypothetical protein
MSVRERPNPLPVELCDHSAELIARKSKHGEKVLIVDWLHASC